ncbi:MAG: TonB-dependent receptor plug domain-containing protein, partial [Phascolarctobacterium sp.]|nr:TonB-dependent receptor plug domain-containing protein [Phascolarctobacterium sp.]
MDKKFTKSILMTALITGSVIWGGTTVFAEENVGEFTLDPMVVTAQRMETRDLDTPASVSVITAKDIEKTGATTVMEAMRRVSGVTDYSYGPGGDDLGSSYSRVFLRG